MRVNGGRCAWMLGDVGSGVCDSDSERCIGVWCCGRRDVECVGGWARAGVRREAAGGRRRAALRTARGALDSHSTTV
eukprot:3714786-Prymnesium_polylepis.2